MDSAAQKSIHITPDILWIEIVRSGLNSSDKTNVLSALGEQAIKVTNSAAQGSISIVPSALWVKEEKSRLNWLKKVYMFKGTLIINSAIQRSICVAAMYKNGKMKKEKKKKSKEILQVVCTVASGWIILWLVWIKAVTLLPSSNAQSLDCKWLNLLYPIVSHEFHPSVSIQFNLIQSICFIVTRLILLKKLLFAFGKRLSASRSRLNHLFHQTSHSFL